MPISALVFCLKHAWLNDELTDIEIRLKDNPNIWEIQFINEYGISGYWKVWNYCYGDIVIDWVQYTVVYKNRDYKMLILKSKFEFSMIYEFIDKDLQRKI